MKQLAFTSALLAVAGLGYWLGSLDPEPPAGVLAVTTSPQSSAPFAEPLVAAASSTPESPGSPAGRSAERSSSNVLPYPVEGPLDTWEKKVARCQEIAIEIGPSRWMQDLYNEVYIGRLESAHFFMKSRESASESDLALLDSMIQSLRGLEQEMRTSIRDEMYRCIDERDWIHRPEGSGKTRYTVSDAYLSVQIPLLEGGGSLVMCRKENVPDVGEKLQISAELYAQAVNQAERMGWEFEPEVARFEEGAFGARRVTYRNDGSAGN